jgi:hypothetical protein
MQKVTQHATAGETLRALSFLPIHSFSFGGVRLLLISFVPPPCFPMVRGICPRVTLVDEGTTSDRNIRTAFWRMGYPAFLATVFHSTRMSLTAAKLANLVCARLSSTRGYNRTRLIDHGEEYHRRNLRRGVVIGCVTDSHCPRRRAVPSLQAVTS